MQTQQIYKAQEVTPIAPAETGVASSESINQVLMVNALGNIDEQIKGISQGLKGEMEQKTNLRNDLNYLNSLSLKQQTVLADGTKAILLDDVSLAKLNTISAGSFAATTGADGKKYITADQMNALKETVSGKIQDLNSGWEMKAIEMQSLMDQRKNMITMLSNIMAVNNETLMGIIRNFKS
ncbi:MAG: hypothetical protein ACD_73C00690G0005 [uncultured bacterium]|nr:MAG: hypothetical protein ACD_73C00690G0005 [uncultured bacterium]